MNAHMLTQEDTHAASNQDSPMILIADSFSENGVDTFKMQRFAARRYVQKPAVIVGVREMALQLSGEGEEPESGSEHKQFIDAVNREIGQELDPFFGRYLELPADYESHGASSRHEGEPDDLRGQSLSKDMRKKLQDRRRYLRERFQRVASHQNGAQHMF